MALVQTSISASIFDELLVTVESIGVEKTIKHLQEARVVQLISEDVTIELILKIVSEVTGVTRECILHGKERSDERKMAIALCVYHTKNEFKYSYADIKKIFDKNEAGLYRYFKTVASLPVKPKTEFDKKLSEYSKQIELLITREKLKK